MRETNLVDVSLTLALSAGLLGASLIPYPEWESPQWVGGILFDDDARRAMQLTAAHDRELAAQVSDGLLGGLLAAPVLIDALMIGWLMRGDPELMGRMLLIDLQAVAIASGLTTLFKHAVGRERPMSRGCREDLDRQATDPSCGGSTTDSPHISSASFFSGHTSMAFTSAALICLHHTEQGLLGPEGDATACVTGMALASTVGVLRILADRHYATDVLLGAGVGVLSGWLVPWLLHYDVADAVGVDDVSATLGPLVDGQTLGVQLFGAF